jgi:hypothetical protein
MGGFPALLQLLRDVEETLCFADAGLPVGKLPLGNGNGVIILDDSLRESPGSNVDFGSCNGFGS